MRQIAIKFKVKHKNGNFPENGGQVISKFLKVSKVNLNRFVGRSDPESYGFGRKSEGAY